MRFSCPFCGAAYRIDRERVPDRGARLDCASCGKRLVIRGDGVVVSADDLVDDELSDGLTESFSLIDSNIRAEVLGREECWHVGDGQGGYRVITASDLVDEVMEGRMTGSDPVRRPGLEAWVPIERDPKAVELLWSAGPWTRGTITSIFEAAELLGDDGDRASVVAADAPAAVAALTGRPTLAPTGLPSDVIAEEEDDLGDRPEVVLANEGLVRPGDAASPVAAAVQRNQRRLLMLAIGIPLFIVLVWTVASSGSSKPKTVVNPRVQPSAQRVAEDHEGRQAERRRRQRLLLEEGSFRLSSDQKAAVVEKGLAELKACGEPRRRGGRVNFRIKPNGAPFDIRVDGMRGDGSRCVRQQVARWRFPRFTGPVDEMSFPLRSH